MGIDEQKVTQTERVLRAIIDKLDDLECPVVDLSHAEWKAVAEAAIAAAAARST